MLTFGWFLLSLLFLERTTNGYIRIPLHKKVTKQIILPNPDNFENEIQIQSRGTASITINDYYGLQYTGSISMGTPRQNFTVLFDTGSSDLWLMNKGSTCTDCNHTYPYTKYDHSTSSTYVVNGTTFVDKYGKGNATGYLSSDMLGIDSIQVRVTFGEATKVSSPGTSDGIFGLAYRSISSEGVAPPFNVLWYQGLLDEYLFSMYLQSDETSDGQLLLGGINSAYYKGSFYYSPIVDEEWYVVDLTLGVKVYNNKYTSGPRGIIDSGTSFIVGPSSDISQIASNLNAVYYSNYGVYIVSCTASLPTIYFSVGDATTYKELGITPYSYRFNSGGTCFLGMQGSNFQDSSGNLIWILGDVFMREWYTVFDVGNSRMGFARSVTSHVSPASSIFISSFSSFFFIALFYFFF